MIKELPSIGILQNDKRYRIFEMQVLQQSIVNVKNQRKITFDEQKLENILYIGDASYEELYFS